MIHNMIIHYNCTRQFLVARVFADLPSLSPSIHEMIFILVIASVDGWPMRPHPRNTLSKPSN